MTFKKIIVYLILIFAGIQLFPVNMNQSDKVPESDFLKYFNSSDSIANILKISCYDCHSNNTNYPWYNSIQPVAFMLEDHITEGKSELNFSEFTDYSKRKQRSKINSMISQIEDDEMPLFSYTIIHRDAILSDENKKLLIRYFESIKDSL